MATVNRTTTTYPTNSTNITAFRNEYTTPLRSAFTQGGKIRATDINLLKDAIDEFNDHTHSVRDYQSIGNYGNNGPRTKIAANPRVSDAMSDAETPTGVTQNAKIFANTINTYVDACNATRDHVHNIYDRSK